MRPSGLRMGYPKRFLVEINVRPSRGEQFGLASAEHQAQRKVRPPILVWLVGYGVVDARQLLRREETIARRLRKQLDPGGWLDYRSRASPNRAQG
jgi:hypothetical protein